MRPKRCLLNSVLAISSPEPKAAAAGRDPAPDAGEVSDAQRDEDGADEDAGRLRLPDEIDGRAEVVGRQAAGEHRNDEVAAERAARDALGLELRIAHERALLARRVV